MARQWRRRTGPIFVGSNSEEDSVARLLNGEVNYTLMADLVIHYIISNHAEVARTRLAFGSTLPSPAPSRLDSSGRRR